LGSALGTGLFLGSGQSVAGAGPAVVLSFVAGTLIAAIVAFALGELCGTHPVRGSFGTIAARYLGPWAGFTVRWLYWLALVAATGGEVVAAAIYLRYWWPQLPVWSAVVVLSLVLTGINTVNVGAFGRTEAALSLIKVLAVVVFLVMGVALIAVGLPGHPATGLGNLTADGGFFPHGVGAIWVVMATVMFSFAGIELVAVAAAETRDPSRAMRSAIRSLIVRLGLFYIGAVAVMVTVLPWRRLAEATGLEQSPFVTMFSYAGIGPAASVTNVVVFIAALSAANANLYAAARMVHSLAHDGFAPRPLRATSAAGSPVPAVVVSLIGLVTAGILAIYTPKSVFLVLISIASFGVIATWLFILATFVAFRRARPPEAAVAATVRLPGGIATAVIGALALLSVYATAAVAPDMATACLVGVPFLLLLGVTYRVISSRRGRGAGSAPG
jgi:L-asparagine transporter-like permease